jgi:GDPmannose 4,6-dehydratase
VVGKVALITGVTGQDGYYLSRLLLDEGYSVYGLLRRCSVEREVPDGVVPVRGDITDAIQVLRAVEQVKPDEVYNLAAMSFVDESFYIPHATMQINALGAVNALEACAKVRCKVYQASTSELFGLTPPPQRETSPFHPRSPYAVAKLAAYWMAVNYREAYGLFAVNGILFNHESPHRGHEFVTQKICRAAARKEKVKLGNINAVRDWGHAEDFVRAMWLAMQQPEPNDYVVATGVGRTVKDLLRVAYGTGWEDFVEIDQRFFRPAEVPALVGDPSRIKALGWKPKWTFEEMIQEMKEACIH